MFEPAFLGMARLAQFDVHVVSGLGMKWWLHHIENTRLYLETKLNGNVQGQLSALGELWNAVLSWQRLTRSATAGLLIAEHTALAKLLVDTLAAKDDAGAKTAVDALGRNVAETTTLFPYQPAQFGALFGEHVAITGKYMTDLAHGDRMAFDQDFQAALVNGRELGVFTDRVVLGR